ncbi:lytic murein transglycosylase [Modestobacter sp. NPDC049651]|uniref:lytic murein transglycosylase n=1 Tax=unclassified Modestobacter TaxID=2643866 RepID=UPI0033DCD920
MPRGPKLVATAGLAAAAIAVMPAASALPVLDAAATSTRPVAPLLGRTVPLAAVGETVPPVPDTPPPGTEPPTRAGAPEPPADLDVPPPDVGVPALDLVIDTSGIGSRLAGNGIPATALDAYTRAADRRAGCGISWSLVAAIGRVESNHGRFAGAVLSTAGTSYPRIIGLQLNGSGTATILDTDGGRLDGDRTHDRAVGPMQFIPSTWSRYASDGNGDGTSDPFNIYDAALATATYLCAAGGGDLGGEAAQARAVFAYNHSAEYVASVLGLAATYGGTPPPEVPDDVAAEEPLLPPADPAEPPAISVVDPPAPAVQPADADQPAPVAEPPVVEAPALPVTDPAVTDPPVLAASETPLVSETPPVTETPPLTETPPVTETPPGTETPPASETPPEPGTETPAPLPATEAPTPPSGSETPTPLPASEPPATETPAPPTTPSPEPPLSPEPSPSPEPEPSPEPSPSPEPEPSPEPPLSPEPSPSPEPEPSPEPAPVPEPSPEPAPVPEPDPAPACPTLTVDVVDGTGDQAAGEEVAAHLRGGDLTVGGVGAPAGPVTSGIEFPADLRAEAEQLAVALGVPDLLRVADVPHVTVVLGADDAAPLQQAVAGFTGLPCDDGADG